MRRRFSAGGLTLSLLVALSTMGADMTIGAAMADSPASMDNPACQVDQVMIFDPSGAPIAGFAVELAITPDAQARGLMHRGELAPGAGMLFIYPDARPVAFWMRNTLIPLDMLFIDAEGVIRHIHPDAVPLDETPIAGHAPDDPTPERLMVLEIAGGAAAAAGIREGMVIAHPDLPQDHARRPCAAGEKMRSIPKG